MESSLSDLGIEDLPLKVSGEFQVFEAGPLTIPLSLKGIPPVVHVKAGATRNPSTPSKSPLPTRSSPSSPATPVTPDSRGSGGSFYCEYCKKKFSNEQTFASHTSSAKHLKEVQRVQQEAAMSSKGATGRSPSSVAAPSSAPNSPASSRSLSSSGSLPEEIGAEVADAMKWQDQAASLGKQGKSRKAALLHWKAAKAFAKAGMLRDLVASLAALISLLEAVLPLIKSKSGDPENLPTVGEAEQLLQQARGAMGRTLLGIGYRVAVPFFVQALSRFVQSDSLNALEELSQVSYAQATQESEAMVADLLAKGRNSPKEQLFPLVSSLLAEVGGTCSLHTGAPTSLAAYLLLASLARALEKAPDEQQALAHLALVYDDLNFPHFASDALLDASALRAGPLDARGLLADSLWLALRAGDAVRCRHLESAISGEDPGDEALGFIREFSLARRTCHWEWFETAGYRLRVLLAVNPALGAIAKLETLLPSIQMYIG